MRLSAADADDQSDFHILKNGPEISVNGATPTSWQGTVYNHDENADSDSFDWIVSVVCSSP